MQKELKNILVPVDFNEPSLKALKYAYNLAKDFKGDAEEIDAGLILVMTHKEGYTYDNYIGAFAHHIINKSAVPVHSLTSAATNIDFAKFLQSFADPAGMLKMK